MATNDSGKLEKLKIHAYNDPDRSDSAGDPFEVMFNPASITIQHQNVYKHNAALGKEFQPTNFRYTQPKEIQLELVIDGTGVTAIGVLNIFGKTKTVADQVTEFLELCFHRDGELHEPKYIRLSWGDGPLKSFDSRLTSVDIEYTAFQENGSPLRATLKTNFIEDLAPKKAEAEERSSSPDLTHTRLVRSGDTLPLLSIEIYGSAKHYLQLAKINNLDNFRDLTPGTELIFPPLEK